MINLTPVTSATHLEQIRALFIEYANQLGIDLCFQGFDQELAELPGCYAAPTGSLWLATTPAGQAVGCIGLRPLDKDRCEIKRLYVREAYRNTGAGRLLANTLLAYAIKVGYTEALLDTLESMKAARALYASLGFEPTQAYYHNPLPGVIYMARRLT
jgi:putative acetyltransferase